MSKTHLFASNIVIGLACLLGSFVAHAALPELSTRVEDAGRIEAERHDDLRFEWVRKRARAYTGRKPRLLHERELLGAKASRRIASPQVDEIEVHQFVETWTQRALKSRKLASSVSRALISESMRHGFDPLFLIAVIENESRFKVKARGRDGEIGLMQVMPKVGKEMAGRLGIVWKGEKTLEDPVLNIRIGSALMARLRKSFDAKAAHYVAAYNTGARKLRELVNSNLPPKIYPTKVVREYLKLYQALAKATTVSETAKN